MVADGRRHGGLRVTMQRRLAPTFLAVFNMRETEMKEDHVKAQSRKSPRKTFPGQIEEIREGGKLRARQQAAKSNIVNAANSILSEKGLSSFTMDDVAQAANVSKATLYKYYGSKDILFEAVIMDFCARNQDSPGIILKDKQTPAELLKTIAPAFVAVMLSPETINLTKRCIEANTAGQSNGSALLWELFYERLYREAVALFKRLEIDSAVEIVSSDTLARHFLSMITAPYLLPHMLNGATSSETLTKANNSIEFTIQSILLYLRE